MDGSRRDLERVEPYARNPAGHGGLAFDFSLGLRDSASSVAFIGVWVSASGFGLGESHKFLRCKESGPVRVRASDDMTA